MFFTTSSPGTRLDMRSQFSKANMIAICLLGVALLLLIYSFSNRIEEAEIPISFPRSTLASESFGNSNTVTRRGLLLSPSSQLRFDDRTTLVFQEQASQRKSMFERGLRVPNPTVPDVMLPIVPEVYCPSLVRIGTVGDGGKWICNPWAMPKGGVVFSLGSNNDISFEEDFQTATGRAANIITVDMNPASDAALSGLTDINAKFVQAMIAPETEPNSNPPHYNVIDLMSKMGVKYIEILKMDIEGAELTVLPQFLNSNSVCQIMVEIHSITNVAQLLRTVANAGFLLQKYEFNTFWVSVGACEFSFIHESCLEKYGASLLARYLNE